MINTKPLEVTDFTGGITDYFIDGRPNQYEQADNLWINPNRKPFTRWGSELYILEQIPLGLFRINKLLFVEEELLAFAQRRGYYNNGGSWNELTGPVSDPVFPDGDANSIISDTEWQGHVFVANDAFSSPQKIYTDDIGNLQVRNAGLPAVPTGVSITNPPGAGNTYLYAFNLKYTYKVGDVTFIDRGPEYKHPTLVTGGAITGGNTASVTLPTSLPIVENWDEANIKIEIARTVNGGTDFFYIGEVTLGTTPFIDGVTDAALVLNEAFYTTGNISTNGQPPKCKFVHVVNDVAYYGFIQDGSDDEAYQIRQSKPGDVDSVPANFVKFAEHKLTGLSSIYDRPIVLTDKYIYRIDNIITATGTGDMDLRRIDDRAGCLGQNSVIQTHKGLFWAGEVGFYWTDGLRVKKISNQLNDTYKKFITNDTRKKRVVATYEPSNERVFWAVSIDDGNNEPDTMFCLDMKWFEQEPPHEACFTTMSASTYFRPTALAVRDDVIYRGDIRGYVLQHKDTIFTDVKIDTAVAPNLWEKLTIIHSYKSCFLDFGSKFLRKFVPRILISADNTTNLSLAIKSSNDNNRIQGDLQPIRYTNSINWGDDLPLWGDPNARWNFQGLIEEWRRFPAGGLRCNYKQVQLTNASVQILTSDLLGLGTVDNALKTVVLGGSFQWINDMVDYTISFETDNYEVEYTITARTPTTITYSDASNQSPAGSLKWIVKGKPKGEILELNGYVIHWAFLSKTHTPFSAGSLGSNP